ncbi:hypothetical protein EAH68_07475 [Corynebacterium hylobatis]|uniref:Uncharacterized protein n=1 Tax=Corynebacterium hylobatis TaxID=1859290 RepID=A0A3R9ZIY7_9CORY|nr:hypothetical protein [Corynebacterium hylobatis]RSZ63492.1 hypothetical protein EAH68_07475 [Corynebacterium hylobatis]
MDIRTEVWSPLQNTAVWLGAWLHGLTPTDNLVGALTDLGGEGLVGVLGDIRRTATGVAADGEPVLRLVLSGPGEAPALPAGGAAAEAASAGGLGALVLRDVDPLTSHILIPDAAGDWQWFVEDSPLPAPAWLSPGEADQLLTQATTEAARLVTASGYRTDALNSPRLTVGTLADFYDTPGLPAAVPGRAAKLFTRADRVAAIIETVIARMNDHRIDPQLLGLWRHVRAARMSGVAYAVREFGRLT